MNIFHNTQERRFEGKLEEKDFFVEYDLSPEGKIIITHTYVHPDLRGQGVASALLENLSKWAEEEKKSIIPVYKSLMHGLNYANKVGQGCYKKSTKLTRLFAQDATGQCRLWQ